MRHHTRAVMLHIWEGLIPLLETVALADGKQMLTMYTSGLRYALYYFLSHALKNTASQRPG